MRKLRHRVVKSFAQCYIVSDSGLNPRQADPRACALKYHTLLPDGTGLASYKKGENTNVTFYGEITEFLRWKASEFKS